ncbi:alpha/beta-hydrolase, partial [Pleomassaria siparia CBS 279.74]
VSSKYLELTKKKLQLTRLPRALDLKDERRWTQGTPKDVLEPILDYWLEHYDWRTQETQFNRSLPQFRTTIQIPSVPAPAQSLKVHFVHKRSKYKDAIPLLFCHSWPSSFIEVHRIIDALTDPHSLPSFGAGAQQSFHVIVPSIPGFGFSDASEREDFGLRETADVFQKVMERLGYQRFVAHGTGWGFGICRALALNHPNSCVAVHTANPSFMEPTFKGSPVAYIKHRIAKLTKAKVPLLSFGYTPDELKQPVTAELDAVIRDLPYSHNLMGTTLRPQTLAFSLCDSPIGLLANLLDITHIRSPQSTQLASRSRSRSRSRSPFLDPGELEMQERSANNEDEIRSAAPTERREVPFGPHESDLDGKGYNWSSTEMLNWTMMQWLPGPEASLRWLQRAHMDTEPSSALSSSFSEVPLGISTFQARNSNSAASTPLMWGSPVWSIAWIKRNQRAATQPAWEAPDLLVLDVRECFGTFLSHGTMANLPFQAS